MTQPAQAQNKEDRRQEIAPLDEVIAHARPLRPSFLPELAPPFS
jgi:hypothetical protein